MSDKIQRRCQLLKPYYKRNHYKQKNLKIDF